MSTSYISFRQQVTIVCGPFDPQNQAIIENDFQRQNPPSTVIYNNLTQTSPNRFVVAPHTVNMPLCIGTLSSVAVFVLETDELDVPLQFVNGNGTSQVITFRANSLSIMHFTDITQVLISNPNATTLGGVYLAAGN